MGMWSQKNWHFNDPGTRPVKTLTRSLHYVLKSIKGDGKYSGFKSVFNFGSLANSKLEISKGS